jgi:hydrogenase nickel incorporation protein HypA/HybF
MHELSISQNIIEIIKENVTENELSKVNKVIIEIGEVSGILPDSLIFCFDIMKLDTPFSSAKMEIKNIPFVVLCNKCKTETKNTTGIRICEKCGNTDTEIISGTEMKITEIELN